MRMGAIPCHFGSDYLAWAVRGIQDAVDQIHIFYAPEPSYGYQVEGAKNPDTEERLHTEAKRFLTPGKEFFWHVVRGTRNEGQHRDLITDEAVRRDAELYLPVDADEIWDPESAKRTLDWIAASKEAAFRWSVNFHHFWRSWKWVQHDGFRPIRAMNMKHYHQWQKLPDIHVPEEAQGWPIFHFGYAQSRPIMEYKFTCHSHSPELREHNWRQWLEDKFYGWQPGEGDTHPICRGLWNPAPTPAAELAKLHELMPEHPFKNLDLI